MSKEKQNYIEKPIYNTCRNCKHMKGNILGEPYYEDNIRCTPILKYIHCGIGGFEVEYTATCNEHSKIIK